jgi:hypothetical protein
LNHSEIMQHIFYPFLTGLDRPLTLRDFHRHQEQERLAQEEAARLRRRSHERRKRSLDAHVNRIASGHNREAAEAAEKLQREAEANHRRRQKEAEATGKKAMVVQNQLEKTKIEVVAVIQEGREVIREGREVVVEEGEARTRLRTEIRTAFTTTDYMTNVNSNLEKMWQLRAAFLQV